MSEHLEMGKQLEFWSKAGSSVLDPQLSMAATVDHQKGYPLERTGRYYKGIYKTQEKGTLVINIWSPRSLRLWINRKLILDETLFWRSFQREVRATAFTTVNSGQQEIFVEVGERSHYFKGLDESCPSRNRAAVMREIERIIPDCLRFEIYTRECARIHLLRMHEVWMSTGKIWENYSSETAAPGKPSMPDYCWSALGPINLLLEVVMGFDPDALHNTMRWNPDLALIPYGINRYPLAENKIDFKISEDRNSYYINVCGSEPFTLLLTLDVNVYELECPAGETSVSYSR